MSTKSLDLSLPLHHRRQLSNELSSIQFTKDLKTKIDVSRLQSYEELGARLIEDRLLLTALELYAELGEAGHEILCLKQFFSNPGNFEKSAKTEISRLLVRSLSQTTLDSLDFAPISEDGDRTGGDRVAILEFELRKAKETITALRENLTQQVELENASIRSDKSESTSSQNNYVLTHQSTPEPMRAYEQRAINFLVHEYLLTHGYRLTSITFADENPEQDFEHWDDVGLNTERPADLLSMFRHRSRPPAYSVQVVQSEDVETQTDETANESDSADVTMQLACSGTNSAEESENNSQEVSSLVSASYNKSMARGNTPILRSTSTNPIGTHLSQPPEPVITRFSVPPNITPSECLSNAPFPPPQHLHSSARALKDELQQGVEDVCQKLNNFFGKPHSQPGSSSSGSNRQTSSGFTTGKSNTDRSSFSLFSSK